MSRLSERGTAQCERFVICACCWCADSGPLRPLQTTTPRRFASSGEVTESQLRYLLFVSHGCFAMLAVQVLLADITACST